MKQSDDNKFIPMTSFESGKGHEITPDVFYFTNQIVNLIMVGKPGSGSWTLIDAGMPKSAAEIIEAAAKRFGKGVAPSAIILTHGHFDHVGSIVGLLSEWKVPVYAHPVEFGFLTGKQDYPEPDPTVEGGLLAKISSYYPNEAIDISEHLQELPADHSVPGLPGWRWIHTPGHTPGHVSFFREADKLLVAGDAFVTVKTDSFYKVLVQKAEVNGPPVYLTTDWEAAETSVRTLAALEPRYVITGHGPAMSGPEMSKDLKELSDNFENLAVPSHGKYVKEKSRH